MRLENKSLLASVFMITLSLVFGLGGIWVFSRFYVYPFLEPDVQKVIADPWMIMSFLVGTSIGMMMMTPINIASRLFRSKNLKIKTILIFMLFLGMVSICANVGLYQWIISPNNMIECPKKIGYKKNLMLDYVKDISQCVKF